MWLDLSRVTFFGPPTTTQLRKPHRYETHLSQMLMIPARYRSDLCEPFCFSTRLREIEWARRGKRGDIKTPRRVAQPTIMIVGWNMPNAHLTQRQGRENGDRCSPCPRQGAHAATGVEVRRKELGREMTKASRKSIIYTPELSAGLHPSCVPAGDRREKTYSFNVSGWAVPYAAYNLVDRGCGETVSDRELSGQTKQNLSETVMQ